MPEDKDKEMLSFQTPKQEVSANDPLYLLFLSTQEPLAFSILNALTVKGVFSETDLQAILTGKTPKGATNGGRTTESDIKG